MKCSLCLCVCRTRVSVLVLPSSRGLGVTEARRLVCPACAARGTLVVPELAKVADRCKCGEAARFCATCAIDRSRKPDIMQKSIARKLRALAKFATTGAEAQDAEAGYHQGRADALEQAASILEAYRSEEDAPSNGAREV